MIGGNEYTLSSVEYLVALAGTTQVESYKRTSKSGKVVDVKAHTRSVKDMSNSDLFNEYQELQKSNDPNSPRPLQQNIQQNRNRLASIVSEIRKRQTAGMWKTDAATPPKEAPRVVRSREKFETNRRQPQPKMADEDYEAHLERIRPILNDSANNKFDTQQIHGIKDPETGKPIPGMYSPQRAEQHREIIEDILAKHKNVPKDRKAVMSGGLGGAGKGYVLENHAGIPESDYITVDPDGMKSELIKRGMIEEIDGLLPMEHAKFIHEESSDLANLLHQVAMEEGYNVILDTTMATEGSTSKKLDKFLEAGYEVEAVFVDVPVEVSLESAKGRHRGGVDRFRGGVEKGAGDLGGRFVPPEYIEKSRPAAGSQYNSVNREVFEKLKDKFVNARVFDNSDRSPGAAPKLVFDSKVVGEGGKKSQASKQTKKAMEAVALSGSALSNLRNKLSRVNS